MEVLARQRTALRICWCAGRAADGAPRAAARHRRRAATAVTEAFVRTTSTTSCCSPGAVFCLWRAVAIREERLPWLVMGFAIVSWTAADIYWTAVYADDPNAALPEHRRRALAGLLSGQLVDARAARALAHARRRRACGSTALIGARRVAALAAALAFGPVVHDGSAGDLERRGPDQPRLPARRPAAAGLIVAIFGLSGWRPGPRLALARRSGSPSTRSATASTSSRPPTAPTRTAASSTRSGRLVAAGRAGRLAADASAPAPRGPEPARGDRPVVCGAGRRRAARLRPLLPAERAHRRRSPPSRCCSCWCARRSLFAENQRMLAQSRRGGAHRPAHRPGQPPQPDGRPRGRAAAGDAPSEPRALVLFDLDGFKEYNDAFGHPAGDGLLARLGERLADAVARPRAAPTGSAATSSASLLRPGAGRRRRAGRRLRWRRCAEHGEGFDVDRLARRRARRPRRPTTPPRRSSSPTGACTPRRASGRASAGARRATSCCAACPSASPTCTTTCAASPTWPSPSAASSGMHGEELDDVARAAELHDVGKIAIPDAILEQARPARRDRVGASCAATRSSASASCCAAPALRRVAQASCARATSAGTAAATRTGWPARRSRSARASSPSATPSTR